MVNPQIIHHQALPSLSSRSPPNLNKTAGSSISCLRMRDTPPPDADDGEAASSSAAAASTSSGWAGPELLLPGRGATEVPLMRWRGRCAAGRSIVAQASPKYRSEYKLPSRQNTKHTQQCTPPAQNADTEKKKKDSLTRAGAPRRSRSSWAAPTSRSPGSGTRRSWTAACGWRRRRC